MGQEWIFNSCCQIHAEISFGTSMYTYPLHRFPLFVANISSTSCFYVAMFDPVRANNASSPDDAADRDHGKCSHPTTGSIWSSKFSKHIFHRKMASQHPPWHPTGASVPQGPQRHAARMDCFSSESLAVPLSQLIYIHNNKAENYWCTRWNSSILHCSATVFVASK